jgi:DNA-binding transcriptional LysR family regulator
MSRLLDPVLLRSFVAVAEAGGVTRAARRLNLTQSAVSMQLKRLEETLGQPLLDRRQRRMAPTAQGEQLLSYARRILTLNEEAWSRLTGPGWEGELTLGAPSDVVYPHVPEVLKRFARTHPRVRVSLVSSYTRRLKAMFEAGEVDVTLTTEDAPGPGAEVLEESDLVWVGAPDGVAWRARPLPLAFEHACIFREAVQRALDAAGIAWTLAVGSESTRTIEAGVSADLAVHVGIAGKLPPRFEAIAHGGELPALPATRVAMYVAEARGGPLAAALAGALRDAWGGARAAA